MLAMLVTSLKMHSMLTTVMFLTTVKLLVSVTTVTLQILTLVSTVSSSVNVKKRFFFVTDVETK